MDSINKLEMMAVSWYKTLPHLPREFRNWLATNAWWLALVGVILGGLAVFSLISATFLVGAVLTGTAGIAGVAVGGIVLVAVILSLALSAVDLVLIAVAISPLKEMKRRGWKLLFLTVLINVLSLAIHFVFTIDLFGLIWGLLMTAVGAYFLFEIRDEYKEDVKSKHVQAKKAA
jgi:hypothetical protein